MRRGRIFFYLAFILILGVVAVVIFWQRFIPKGGEGDLTQVMPTEPPTRVAVVTQFTPKGTILDDTVVNLIPWQKDSVAIGMFSEDRMTEVLGRQVKYDLQPGTPLLEMMLVGAAEQLPMTGSSWAMNIPPGMIAVSIPIDRLSSVSYAPRAGDHVDVIASMLFVDLDTDFQTVTPNYTGIVTASGPPNPDTKESDPVTSGVGSLLPKLPENPDDGSFENPQSEFPGVYGKVEIDPVLGQPVLLVPSEDQRPRLATQMMMQDLIVLQMGDFDLEQKDVTPAEETLDANMAPVDATQENKPKIPVVATLIVRPQEAVTLNYLIFRRGANAGIARPQRYFTSGD